MAVPGGAGAGGRGRAQGAWGQGPCDSCPPSAGEAVPEAAGEEEAVDKQEMEGVDRNECGAPMRPVRVSVERAEGAGAATTRAR